MGKRKNNKRKSKKKMQDRAKVSQPVPKKQTRTVELKIPRLKRYCSVAAAVIALGGVGYFASGSHEESVLQGPVEGVEMSLVDKVLAYENTIEKVPGDTVGSIEGRDREMLDTLIKGVADYNAGLRTAAAYGRVTDRVMDHILYTKLVVPLVEHVKTRPVDVQQHFVRAEQDPQKRMAEFLVQLNRYMHDRGILISTTMQDTAVGSFLDFEIYSITKSGLIRADIFGNKVDVRYQEVGELLSENLEIRTRGKILNTNKTAGGYNHNTGVVYFGFTTPEQQEARYEKAARIAKTPTPWHAMMVRMLKMSAPYDGEAIIDSLLLHEVAHTLYHNLRVSADTRESEEFAYTVQILGTEGMLPFVDLMASGSQRAYRQGLQALQGALVEHIREEGAMTGSDVHINDNLDRASPEVFRRGVAEFLVERHGYALEKLR
ncbi:hypothetical protein KY362_02535 [Candidatus Woesearchaeota archaeon]|nr:hypothetical protein [Candidatus Woesearchaeota archaeon]